MLELKSRNVVQVELLPHQIHAFEPIPGHKLSPAELTIWGHSRFDVCSKIDEMIERVRRSVGEMPAFIAPKTGETHPVRVAYRVGPAWTEGVVREENGPMSFGLSLSVVLMM